MARNAKRLPETKTLHDLLPAKSAASGREFARIVNLLLFHDGRRNQRTVRIFDDRAGDYHGLDAFEKKGRAIAVGYQHKFFSSPLTDHQRRVIDESLRKTVESLAEAKIRLEKWVLVTPEDLVESSVRKTGGDVTWFESLSGKYDLEFPIEAWGHTQLQGLLLETPSIGLYYYPELFSDGVERRKTIQELRGQYDTPFESEHGRIEFVGMSVYKEEAARSVLMEDIYIPLSVVPNNADDEDPNVQRTDPLDLLTHGTRHVILGDPGSGKTTLLRFLGLFGQSKALQKRYFKGEEKRRKDFKIEERLPIFVTLRRYADALKSRDNLSLVDYFRETIEADFSIVGVSTEFLEYYLESGQALLLFDGLDELPNSSFKKKIRDRIRHLTETYPGNTTIVTSRIYGYEGAFRFDEKEADHHRLAKLRPAEIEQFVEDWYRARLEKSRDRREYLASMLKILREEEHVSIRELARNPLLLTIMVLVHRIDAVLPDERHVLYKKCTETLLNTWHTWKFHEIDRLHRAKVDRHNMQRMQAIAYWMHQRMGETQERNQAVVSYEDLHECLRSEIETEKPPNPDHAPEDIATVFIEFVQDRAGLLVEIGDRQFSFVHLTFQEYLTAAHIYRVTEPHSLEEAWRREIKTRCSDPRWGEVIRLLVARYRSDESQEILLDKMLALDATNPTAAQLLGGLVLDGIAAAEMKAPAILQRLLTASASVDDGTEVRNTLRALRACRERIDGDWQKLGSALGTLAGTSEDAEKLSRLRLAALAIGMAPEGVWELCGRGSERESAMVSVLTGRPVTSKGRQAIALDLHRLSVVSEFEMFSSPSGSMIAAAFLGFSGGMERNSVRNFELLLKSLNGSVVRGPARYLTSYVLVLARTRTVSRFGQHLRRALDRARARALDRALARDLDRARARALDRALARDLALDRALDRALALARDLDRALARDLDRARARDSRDKAFPENEDVLWKRLVSDQRVIGGLLDLADMALKLQPKELWQELMREAFVPSLHERIPLVDPEVWARTNGAFSGGRVEQSHVYTAASHLILDGLLYVLGYHQPDPEWLQKELSYTKEHVAEHEQAAKKSQALWAELAELTASRDEAPLRIAHCLRDLSCGDESRAGDLKEMVESEDPEYREIFERCYWRNPAKP